MFVMHGNIGFAADFIDCLLFSMTGSYFIPKWVLGPFWSWYDFGPYVIASRRKEASYGRCLLLSMASSWHWSGFQVFNFVGFRVFKLLIFFCFYQKRWISYSCWHCSSECLVSVMDMVVLRRPNLRASKYSYLIPSLVCFLAKVCGWLLCLSYFD